MCDNNQASNPPLNLGRSIAILSRYSRWFMDQKMTAYDFGSGQHGFIFYLYDHNGASQDEISKALELDKATTARAIQKLEDNGYVTRKTSEKDKRINNVFLTEKAYAIQQEIRQFSAEWTTVLTHDMTPDELSQLSTLMAKLTENAHNTKTKLTNKTTKKGNTQSVLDINTQSVLYGKEHNEK